jgi:hypothetical protein
VASIAGAVPDGALEIVEDGDHSFKVLKRTPKTSEEVLDEVANAAAAWIITRL